MWNPGGSDWASATCGRRRTLRIGCLVAESDMTLDWCRRSVEQRVSQYMYCTWTGIDQNPAVQFAKYYCCLVDGGWLNKACCTSAHSDISHATFRVYSYGQAIIGLHPSKSQRKN